MRSKRSRNVTTSQGRNALRPLTNAEIVVVAGGVGYDLTSGYGIVTALEKPASGSVSSLYPFTSGTGVPAQAAASYYNPCYIGDGLYTAGQSPYGSGSPVGHVGNS